MSNGYNFLFAPHNPTFSRCKSWKFQTWLSAARSRFPRGHAKQAWRFPTKEMYLQPRREVGRVAQRRWNLGSVVNASHGNITGLDSTRYCATIENAYRVTRGNNVTCIPISRINGLPLIARVVTHSPKARISNWESSPRYSLSLIWHFVLTRSYEIVNSKEFRGLLREFPIYVILVFKIETRVWNRSYLMIPEYRILRRWNVHFTATF